MKTSVIEVREPTSSGRWNRPSILSLPTKLLLLRPSVPRERPQQAGEVSRRLSLLGSGIRRCSVFNGLIAQ